MLDQIRAKLSKYMEENNSIPDCIVASEEIIHQIKWEIENHPLCKDDKKKEKVIQVFGLFIIEVPGTGIIMIGKRTTV